MQKLYTDFLASQLESNKAKAEEVVQDFEKAIGKKWPYILFLQKDSAIESPTVSV